ncbi:MAG: 3-isopropylmalate dehydratase large subunit [Chloroflexi bacterium]|nr:3-isopropylmalate dehydratase large subunit [Chloroflexota bacterium]
MTLAEKILAAHCNRRQVQPGELVNVRVDLVLANDITAPLAIKEFGRVGVDRVFDPKRVVLVADHFAPAKDIPSAGQIKMMRDFARAQSTLFFDGGEGIEHVLLPEQGLVVPGDVAIGADSHTCTYGALGAFATGMGSTDIACAMATGDIWMKVPPSIKLVYRGQLRPWVGGKDLILHTIGRIGVDGALYAAMEFTGQAVAALSLEGRFTMANMAIEAGAKAGLFAVDRTALTYVKGRAQRPYTVYSSSADARYQAVEEFDASAIEPQVALPHIPSNSVPVSQARGMPIDQVVIGSCTNGRLEDLVTAGRLMAGRKVHEKVRCIVIPGSRQVYLEALRQGLVQAFVESGAAVSTPTCGPCLGGYMGVLAEGERCLSTTNRNFVGRMGSPKSEVCLAGPAVAAASAVLGRIASPEELEA